MDINLWLSRFLSASQHREGCEWWWHPTSGACRPRPRAAWPQSARLQQWHPTSGACRPRPGAAWPQSARLQQWHPASGACRPRPGAAWPQRTRLQQWRPTSGACRPRPGAAWPQSARLPVRGEQYRRSRHRQVLLVHGPGASPCSHCG